MADTKQEKDPADELGKEELECAQGAGPKYTVQKEKTEERISTTRVGGDERKRSRFSEPG